MLCRQCNGHGVDRATQTPCGKCAGRGNDGRCVCGRRSRQGVQCDVCDVAAGAQDNVKKLLATRDMAANVLASMGWQGTAFCLVHMAGYAVIAMPGIRDGVVVILSTGDTWTEALTELKSFTHDES